jgi:hypothetical protein
VPLLRELPGGGPAAAVLARFPKATERSYRWISEHRDVLARPLSDASRRRADARIERRRAA